MLVGHIIQSLYTGVYGNGIFKLPWCNIICEYHLTLYFENVYSVTRERIR